MNTVATRTTVARATRLVLDELDRARIAPTRLNTNATTDGTMIVSLDLASRGDCETAARLLNLYELRETGGWAHTTGRPFAGIDLIVSIEAPLPVEIPADCDSASFS